MTLRDLVGLPAAPVTYTPVRVASGPDVYERVIRELALMPWVQILGAEPGEVMPGDFSSELKTLADAHTSGRLGSREFIIRSLGLREYHNGTLRLTLRVLHFQTFIGWVNSAARFLNHCLGTNSIRIEFVPHPHATIYSLQVRYDSPEALEKACSVLFHTLEDEII